MLIFLDTETTDKENGRLVQLAYTKGFVIVEELYKPAEPITIEAMSVHHITNKQVENRPELSIEKRQILSELFEQNIICAHNAKFDIGVLNREGIKTGTYICTLKIAQKLLDLPQYKLQYLRYFFDIGIDATAHNAEGDIRVLERVYKKLFEIALEEKGASYDSVMSDFIEISKKPVLLRRIGFGKYKGMSFSEVDKSYLSWLRRQDDLDEDLIYTLDYYLKN